MPLLIQYGILLIVFPFICLKGISRNFVDDVVPVEESSDDDQYRRRSIFSVPGIFLPIRKKQTTHSETQQVNGQQYFGIKSDKNNSGFQQNYMLFGISFLFLITSILAGNEHYKRKSEKRSFRHREAFLTSEKKQVELELKQSEKNLANHIALLSEQTKRIEVIQHEIENMLAVPDNDLQVQAQSTLEKLHHTTIITEDGWQQFKELFCKVHQGFFIRLQHKYPRITPSEIRLLALLKLKISSKEMASLLGVSPDSIKKSRYRLRKKIHPDADLTLEDIAATV